MRSALSDLRRFGLRVSLATAATQAALVGGLVAMDKLRKRREGPREGFPWVDQPEIELESGDNRLKLYPYGVDLYEAMLDEIEGARERIFLGTFIWKDDEVGRRFVSASRRRPARGSRCTRSLTAWRTSSCPARSFKCFPGEMYALHSRPFSEPTSYANPRHAFRYHRHMMSVDG